MQAEVLRRHRPRLGRCRNGHKSGGGHSGPTDQVSSHGPKLCNETVVWPGGHTSRGRWVSCIRFADLRDGARVGRGCTARTVGDVLPETNDRPVCLAEPTNRAQDPPPPEAGGRCLLTAAYDRSRPWLTRGPPSCVLNSSLPHVADARLRGGRFWCGLGVGFVGARTSSNPSDLRAHIRPPTAGSARVSCDQDRGGDPHGAICPGLPPHKVFWSTESPRVEAVFPHPFNER